MVSLPLLVNVARRPPQSAANADDRAFARRGVFQGRAAGRRGDGQACLNGMERRNRTCGLKYFLFRPALFSIAPVRGLTPSTWPLENA
jgi:hypothetical protein